QGTASRSTRSGGRGVKVSPARNCGCRQSHTRTGSKSMLTGRPFQATVAGFNAPCACIEMLNAHRIPNAASAIGRTRAGAERIHTQTGIRKYTKYGRTSVKKRGPYE